MNLQEAVQSGKQFTRETLLSEGDVAYYEASDWVEAMEVADVLATDYTLMPDELTLDVLAAIWDRNKLDSTPSATESKFFAKLLSELQDKGFVKVSA